MSKSPADMLRWKATKDSSSAKRRTPVSSIYSGAPSAQRALQQQGQSRSRRPPERTIPLGSEKSEPPSNYHPWQPEYSVILTRAKCRKSMTKDPYTHRTRLITNISERIMTEEDCCPPLIPANVIQIHTLDMRCAPKSFKPMIRYLRRNDSIPSESRTTSPLKTSTIQPLTEIQTSTSTTVVNVIKKTVAFDMTDRLLNRPKIQTDLSIIRRPPRRMLLNVSHETIMPLAVYG